MSRLVSLSTMISTALALIASAVLASCDHGSSTGNGSETDGAAAPSSSVGALSADSGPACDLSGDGGPCRFEGTIQIVLEQDPDAPTQRADELPPSERFTFTALGDAYRWDLFENSVARGDFRIYDRSAHRFYSVLQSQSIIFSVPESDKLVIDPNASYVLEDQHKVGKVAGIGCENFKVSTPMASYEICATDKLTPFPFHMMPGLMRQIVPFGGELMNRKLYPLLVNEYFEKRDAGSPTSAPPASGTNPTVAVKVHFRGRPDSTFRAVVVQQQKVDPEIFALPKYPIQRIDLLQAAPKMKR